jgi:2-phosphoglycolate phosphatase
MRRPIGAVLFDLDGTLIDSAPDLAGTGNDMRRARGLAPLLFEAFRPMVGAGARGMLGVALQVSPADLGFDELREEFLRRYEQRMTQETRVFEGIVPVLSVLHAKAMPWGIVTNKARRFTDPLVRALGLHERAATVISGDTTPHAKPHPAPLLEAARQMELAPELCIYVGDDLRDVQAGQAAGMQTVAAAWGYLGMGEPVADWGADHVIESPDQLLTLLGLT